MTEEEFDVLDELYFIISFEDLISRLEIDRVSLASILSGLKEKDWLRVYSEVDEEVVKPDLTKSYESYLYLASKKGLMAHNRQ